VEVGGVERIEPIDEFCLELRVEKVPEFVDEECSFVDGHVGEDH
jgi:hypothetical protein